MMAVAACYTIVQGEPENETGRGGGCMVRGGRGGEVDILFLPSVSLPRRLLTAAGSGRKTIVPLVGAVSFFRLCPPSPEPRRAGAWRGEKRTFRGADSWPLRRIFSVSLKPGNLRKQPFFVPLVTVPVPEKGGRIVIGKGPEWGLPIVPPGGGASPCDRPVLQSLSLK